MDLISRHAGTFKSEGSGSVVLKSVMMKFCFPIIGPVRIESRLTPSSWECHVSLVAEGLIVAHHADINGVRLSTADDLDPGNALVS